MHPVFYLILLEYVHDIKSDSLINNLISFKIPSEFDKIIPLKWEIRINEKGNKYF